MLVQTTCMYVYMHVCTPRTHSAQDSECDQKTNKKQTPYFRTYSQRTLFDLPQTLYGGRARRAHHKRCQPFFDLIHKGQNFDFWLLSKNNTGRLPLRGILPVKILLNDSHSQQQRLYVLHKRGTASNIVDTSTSRQRMRYSSSPVFSALPSTCFLLSRSTYITNLHPIQQCL